jgi:hypothetical protein
MSLEDAIRDIVLGIAPELVALVRAEVGRSRLLPIRETPVSSRRILEAERAGELQVYRVGHTALVDEAELHAWIKRTGTQVATTGADPIAELVSANDARRRRGGGRAA